MDIRGGNGEVSYETYQSGYYLDQVNEFLRRKIPSGFQGTWMIVVFWDAVHPYFGASSSEVRKLVLRTLFLRVVTLFYFFYIGKLLPSYFDH